MKYFIAALIILIGYHASAAMVGLSDLEKPTVSEWISSDISKEKLADSSNNESLTEDPVDFDVERRIAEATQDLQRSELSLEHQEETHDPNAKHPGQGGNFYAQNRLNEPLVWANTPPPFEVALPLVGTSSNRPSSGLNFQIIPEPQSALFLMIGLAIAAVRRTRRTDVSLRGNQ